MNDAERDARGEEPPRKPRVVMLLLNPFEHDTRVYKQAQSLIAWGCEVHIVALTKKGLPLEEVIDGIQVHRVTAPRRDLWRTLRAWRVARRGPDAILSALSVDESEPTPTEAVAAKSANPGDDARGPRFDRFIDHLRRERHTLRQRGQTGLRLAALDLSAIGYRMLGRPRSAHAARVARAARITRLPATARKTAKRVVKSVSNVKHTALRPVSLNGVLAERAIALEPDVIEAHDLNTLLAGFLAKRVTGAPLIYDSHELYLERNIGDRVRWWDKAGWSPIESQCIRDCDAVMTVAEGICRHLEGQYGLDEVVLLRNVQPWEPPADRSTLLADDLGIAPETPIILYPGAITINRGLEQLIDAAPRLRHGVVVIMGYAGNAKYGEEIRERARTNGSLGKSVFFRDAVPVQEVSRYVASATLGVVPTQGICLSYRFESSNKIFHCLMAGVPIVGSDHPEKRLLIERWKTGRLFDETDPREIARVIDETLADSSELQRMRSACIRAARELNWEHEEHRLRTVFKNVLGSAIGPVPPVAQPTTVDVEYRSGSTIEATA